MQQINQTPYSLAARARITEALRLAQAAGLPWECQRQAARLATAYETTEAARCYVEQERRRRAALAEASAVRLVINRVA